MGLSGRKPEDLGLGYEVQIDPHTGGAHLRVQVPVPAGRAGLAPVLALDYASTSGNSEIGVGWNLSWSPAIGLYTRDHVPRWDGCDPIQFGGAEVVPWLDAVQGEWSPRRHVDDTWSVGFFRVRRGALQLRLERWQHVPTGRTHYRTRDARNLVTIYGARPAAAARIADPDDEARTLAWLPELQLDPHGNAVWFQYAREDQRNVDIAAPSEPRRFIGTQRYLKRVLYGNARPLDLSDEILSGELPSDLRWCFQVVLDYGDHSDPEVPDATPDRSWRARLDPFTTGRPGFPVRTHRLCRRILSYHHVEELGSAPSLVGALVLDHSEQVEGATVRALSYTGYRRDGEAVTSKALPPLLMSYAPAGVTDTFAPLRLANVPAGLDGGTTLVDLFGDGLPGILSERDRAWHYKRNLGGGKFADQVTLLERPSTRPRSLVLGDHNGDGDVEAAAMSGRLAGSFRLDRDTGTWRPWRPLAEIPHVEAWGPHAQWLDLNGDGLPDLLVSGRDELVWYPSTETGFAGPIVIPRPDVGDAAPMVNASAMLDLYFADMNGDGLADLVRIQEGRIAYWPSLGNGQFGDMVVMGNIPALAAHGPLDSRRVRFVDLDGSGTADLVYLGQGEVTCWLNSSGNSFRAGPRLAGLPYFDQLSDVSIIDLLGDCRPCLVWSDPLPAREAAMSCLPLVPALPPRLLVAVDDSLGCITRLEYSTSAAHHLRDIERGRSWSTHLPRNGIVADRRIIEDLIAGTRSETRLEYHDGFFDGSERAMRGFGCVDVYDAAFADTGVEADGAALAPPSLTRTWFHLGTAMWHHEALHGMYSGDPDLPTLPPHVLYTAGALDPETADDGLRTLAGKPVRREVWSVDAGGAPSGHPFSVEQTSYGLVSSQPKRGAASAGFTSFVAENLTAVYELESQDPRITHHIAVEVDAYDVVTRSASIAYARREGKPRDIAAQGRHHMTVADRRVLNIDTVSRFELAIDIEGRRFELALPPVGRVDRQVLRAAEVAAAIAAPAPFDVDLPDAPATPVARLLAWSQSYFWNAARSGTLPLGSVAAPTLVHHDESACFTPELIAEALGNRVDAARLADLGYFARDGYWWTKGPTRDYAPADDFSLRLGVTRSDGAATRCVYDSYRLLPIATIDALGAREDVEVDYNLLAPWRVVDPNGLVSEVRFDPLGVVVQATQYGAVDGASWGFDALANVPTEAPADLEQLIADPALFVGGGAAFTWYDLHGWQRDATPPVIATVARETLLRDRDGVVSPGRLHRTVTYLDGMRRPLQVKIAAEPGPAIHRDDTGVLVIDASGAPLLAPSAERWRVDGGVVHDQKQQPARVFEPYFSPTSAYEPDAILHRLGVSTLVLFDALGREVARRFPNGSYATTTYRAWSTDCSDANDNVADSIYRALRAHLPPTSPEAAALAHGLAHAGTSNTTFLDPLGRPSGTLARGGATADDRRAETRMDINGVARSVVDARGLVAATSRADMRGNLLAGTSIDAGASAQLGDALGRPVLSWTNRGSTIERTFDVVDRPMSIIVRGGDDALDHEIATWTYGDTLPAEEAQRRNAFGRVIETRDTAGVVAVGLYDPRGQVIESSRQLRDGDGTPDWREATALGETFRSSLAFDAFGRPRREVLADGTIRELDHVAGGALARIRITTPGGELSELTVLDQAEYEASGQLTSIRLGNGVVVQQTYDRATTRLATQTAMREGRRYQAIEYTYDPAGNLIRLVDAAHTGPGALIPNVAVSARRDFTYDAHYRLRRDTGRVHQALVEADVIPGVGNIKGTRHLSLNNGAAVEGYTREYDYDPSGNLRSLRHVAASRTWVREMWVSPTSNRSVPALDDNDLPVNDPESRFDAGGNLVTVSHLRSLTWDWHGNLERAVVIARPGGINDDERYLYDGTGQRIRKRATRLIQGGQTEITEKVYLGVCERKRILRNGQIVLERWSTRVGAGVGATIHRWTVDTLARETDDIARVRVHYRLPTKQASSAIELDEAGELISYEEYFSHGGTAFIAGDDARGIARKDYRYCGKECDDATGLYYFGARYYAPWLTRWLSPDPAGFVDDFNLYQYVLGDPVGKVDPDGRQTTLGIVNSRDEATAIKQFNSRDGLLYGIQVTDAEFKNGNWHIVSYNRLNLSKEDRLKIYMSEMVGYTATVQHEPTGDGWGIAKETDDDKETDTSGAPDGEPAGDPTKDPKAAVGFDDMDVAGKEYGEDSIGYNGDDKGTGGGREGRGAASRGAKGNGDEGGNSDASGSGDGPGLGVPTGGGGGTGASGDGIGARGGSGGTPGATPGKGKGGAGRPGKPGTNKPGKTGGDGKGTRNKAGSPTGSPTGSANGTADVPQALPSTGAGRTGGTPNAGSEAGTEAGTGERPYDGNSRTGSVDGDHRAFKPGDPNGRRGGSDQGRIGGSKDGDREGRPAGSGWFTSRFDGSEDGSFNGVPGCGGDYVPPDWLAPWLQASTILPDAMGAAMEIGAGLGLLIAPEPTMATKVAGVALIAHGADSMWSVMTGERTYTSRGIEHVASSAGASPQVARFMGDAGDIAVPIAVGGVAALGRRGVPGTGTPRGTAVVSKGSAAEGKAAGVPRSVGAAAADNPALANKVAPPALPTIDPTPPLPALDTSIMVDPFFEKGVWGKRHANSWKNNAQQYLYIIEEETDWGVDVLKIGTSLSPQTRYTPKRWTNMWNRAFKERGAWSNGNVRLRIIGQGDASSIRAVETRLIDEYTFINGEPPVLNFSRR